MPLKFKGPLGVKENERALKKPSYSKINKLIKKLHCKSLVGNVKNIDLMQALQETGNSIRNRKLGIKLYSFFCKEGEVCEPDHGVPYSLL